MSHDQIRALVIDGQQYSRVLTVRLLRSLGIRSVSEAADGAAGLEAYARHWPHVVLCSTEMAPVDGFVFLQALVAEKRYLNRVAPVILVSSDAKESVVAEARRLGAAGLLLRPLSATAVRRQLDNVLGQMDLYGDIPTEPGLGLTPLSARTPEPWRLGV